LSRIGNRDWYGVLVPMISDAAGIGTPVKCYRYLLCSLSGEAHLEKGLQGGQVLVEDLGGGGVLAGRPSLSLTLLTALFFLFILLWLVP